jgi:anthraniloyl-CoA monooxygenase
VRVSAPDTEAGIDQADETVARGLAAGACLVAVGDGTPLTRRLVCEAARLGRGAVTMLLEDGTEDAARTAVLSGRADLIGSPEEA